MGSVCRLQTVWVPVVLEWQITNCVGVCSAGVADYKLCGGLYCWNGRLQTVWVSVLLEWQS